MRSSADGNISSRRHEVRRYSLRKLVYDEIRDAIISGRISPGEFLTIQSLADKHGISRTPIREAFLQLAEEGLLIVLPQVGARVALIDAQQVAEAQFVREVLERACLAKAVAYADSEAVESLARVVRRQHEAIELSDSDSFYHWDQQFHAIMCGMSGHKGISRITLNARAHLDRVRRLSLRDNRDLMHELVKEHEEVLEGIRSKDFYRADEALKTHLRKVFVYMSELMKQRPDLFTEESKKYRLPTDFISISPAENEQKNTPIVESNSGWLSHT